MKSSIGGTTMGIDLSQVVQDLDITDSELADAEGHYKAVGDWLGKDDSPLAANRPTIYPQGSFLLGTMIRPVGKKCELDIDLVCLLQIDSAEISQKRLKEVIGLRLKQNGKYGQMIEEKKRCWRLNYAGDFHMDILPAAPNKDGGQDAILVPDKDLSEWHHSDPKGYAEWFKGRMATQLYERRKALAAAKEADIEEIPDHRVKTTLQQSIQLLKRHRDVMFQSNDDAKPISIIITTLSAQAFAGEDDLGAALMSILSNMDRYVERRNYEYWIPNPIDPKENFADKWQDHPDRRQAFFDWLEQARSDFASVLSPTSGELQKGTLTGVLGLGGVSTTGPGIDKQVDEVEAKKARRLILRQKKFEVSHRQFPPWSFNEYGQVSIRATMTLPHGHRPTVLESDSTSLSKNISLLFKPHVSGVVKPYAIYWQVVNTGEEAMRRGDPRGGFVKDTSLRRNESTLYTGMHWIECFVVKDGICVARSGEFVVNIE